MQSLWKKDFCGCGGLSVLWEKGSIDPNATVCVDFMKEEQEKYHGFYTEKEKKENDRWEVIEAIVGLVTFTILFGVFG